MAKRTLTVNVEDGGVSIDSEDEFTDSEIVGAISLLMVIVIRSSGRSYDEIEKTMRANFVQHTERKV